MMDSWTFVVMSTLLLLICGVVGWLIYKGVRWVQDYRRWY